MSIDGARDTCIISPTQIHNEAAMSACKLAAEAAAAAVERAKKLESSTAIAAAMAASRVLATGSHTSASPLAASPAPALHVPTIAVPMFAIARSTAEALKRSSAQHMHSARQQLIDSKLAYLSPGFLSHTHPAAHSHPMDDCAPPSTNQRHSASAVPVSFAALTAVITGKRTTPGIQTAPITSKRVPPGVPTAAATLVKFEQAEMPQNSTGPVTGPASLHVHQRWPEEEESDVKKRQRLSGLSRFATDCGTLAANCGVPGKWVAGGSTQAASSQQAPKLGNRAYALPVGSGSAGFNPRAAVHAPHVPHPQGTTVPFNTSSSSGSLVASDDLAAGHATAAAATALFVMEIIESARAATLHHERKRLLGEPVRLLNEQLAQLSTLPPSHFETLPTSHLLTLLQLIDSCTKVSDVQVGDSGHVKPLERYGY